VTNSLAIRFTSSYCYFLQKAKTAFYFSYLRLVFDCYNYNRKFTVNFAFFCCKLTTFFSIFDRQKFTALIMFTRQQIITWALVSVTGQGRQ